MKIYRLWIGDDIGDLAAAVWSWFWRLSGWGLEMTMETQRVVNGADALDWRRHCRLSSWGVETTMETASGAWRPPVTDNMISSPN